MFGRSGQMFPNPRIPENVGKIYYEVELGVVIGRKIFNISEENALESVAGYFVALDVTAKDLLRVYHDAMYEDEYNGSQQSDADCCCRSRAGISAIACWFLSVLILLGLAASIILTVFFVFRSRTFIGKATEDGTINTNDDDLTLPSSTISNGINDLDLKFNGGTRQTTFKYDDTIQEESSSEVHDFVVPSPKSMPIPSWGIETATTTRRPSSVRQHPQSISPVINYKSVVVQGQNPVISKAFSSSSPSPSSTITSRKAYNDLVRSTTPHSFNYGLSSSTTPITLHSPTKDQLDLQSSLSTTTSRSAMIKLIMDTMNKLQDAESVEDSVFPATLSKNVIEKLKALNKKHQRKNSNNNDDIGREDRTRDDEDDDAARESDENLEKLIATIIATGSSSAETKRRVQQSENDHYIVTTLKPTSVSDFFDDFIGISNHGKKKSSKEDQRMHVTATTTSTSTPHHTSRGDLLTRIIKNLAPKFKSKTEKPTSGSATNSAEKRIRWSSSSDATSTTTTTANPNPNVIIITPTVILPSGSSSSERRRKHGLEIVKAPTLSWTPSTSSSTAGPTNDSKSPEQEMLDILVSSQDTKTMITKETEGGIMTSVILPPWYVNDTYEDGQTKSSSISPNDQNTKGENSTIIIYPNDNSGEVVTTSTTYAPPSLGNLFRNLFFNTPLYGDKNPDSNTKKPSHFEEKKDSATNPLIIRRRIKSTTSSPGPHRTPLLLKPANNGFHKVSPDGKTNIYGYYPESDEIMHFSDSKRIPIPTRETPERGDEANTSPSHVIDIEYDRKIQPEIIVDNNSEEDDDDNDDNLEDEHHNDGDFLYGGYAASHRHDSTVAGSSIRPQILAPPSGMKDFDPSPTGGGIRHPVSMLTEEDSKSEGTNLDNDLNKKEGTPSLDEIITPTAPASLDSNGNEDIPAVGIHMKGSSKETAEISRQPVKQLDESLYPPQIVKPKPADSQEIIENSSEQTRQNEKIASADDSKLNSNESTTKRNVYEVYAVKYTTTNQPKRKNKNSKEHSSSTEAKSKFEAPEPINFHSNTFSFSPSMTTGGFLPAGNVGESWRPLEKDRDRLSHGIRHVRTSTPTSPKIATRPVKQFFNRQENVKQSATAGQQTGVAQSSLWFHTTDAPPSLSPPPQKPAKLPIRPSQPIPPPPTPPMHHHQPQHSHNSMQYMSSNPHEQIFHQHHNGNHLVIDRSKYLHRPAPPPILMRRTPQQTPHFAEANPPIRKMPPQSYPPQYLSNQQQLLRQQQQLHQHLTRMKGQNQHNRGHMNWPLAK